MSLEDVRSALKEMRARERKRKRPSERDLNAAMEVIRRDYMCDVNDLAEEALDQIVDGRVTSPEEFTDWLHETVDGARRVVITFQAKLGLLATDNAEAYEEDFGEAPAGVEQAMYAALQRDVFEVLDTNDVDPGDEDTYEPEEEDEED